MHINQRPSWPRRLLRILLFLALLAAVIYMAVACMVLWMESHLPPAQHYDAIIVLGAQVKPDGTPNLQLQWRLDAAFSAWQRHNCPVVVCGAQGVDEPAPEGDVMREYLITAGIPAEDILTDTASFNTRENLRNAASLLSELKVRTVLIVTSDYHVPRALALAGDVGLEASGLPSRTLGGWYWLKNHLREPLAWIKYWIEKYLNVEIRNAGFSLIF